MSWTDHPVRPLFLLAALAVAPTMTNAQEATPLRFEVTMAEGLIPAPADGRLFVILDPRRRGEPRHLAGQTGLDAAPMLARDVTGFGPGASATIDARAIAFPIADLAHLPAGDYAVQAVFDRNTELRHGTLDGPGNLYSDVRRVHLDPARGEGVALTLGHVMPDDRPPAETPRIKPVTIRSEKLGAFHGRPITLRATVLLPRDFEREPERRYPLRVHIGGYGSRRTILPRDWQADDLPRMVVLVLDGAGPFGDPYQVNSDNNGPYGDAITEELIPHVEREFRCIGKPHARVLDGGSTGGWVALALQVFYPDVFNGAWASCPDSVDFRSFQLINIYEDGNAYVNPHGFERPAARDVTGEVRYTMRHECGMENVLGRGDSWAMSGGQWGAWNAAYGPRGADGRPVPLWDPRTGRIDRKVAEHWKNYDLRLILERDWRTLGPRLRGKLHIWVGEADDFFLNNAVHRLDAFLSKADPPYGGSIVYGPGQGHCWMDLSPRAMMEQMAAAVAAGQGAESGR
jgi:hypothetical protein